MLRSRAERLLGDMIRENRRALRKGDDAPLSPEQEARRRDRRGDLTIAALGVTLGLICALFPWYIFFNPDEFGVRAMRFGGGGTGAQPIVLGAQGGHAPAESQEVPLLELDLRPTGSAIKDPHDQSADDLSDADEQPFPPPVIEFRVVQIANGRAMLEDDSGLFVVQAGSVLPDGARVQLIGEHEGRPVLVTEAGNVFEIAK